MAQETWVQSQVESYQRLKKWYLMLPCLTFSIIRYRSRVKVEQFRERSSALPTPWCSSYRKGSLRVTLDYGCKLYLHFGTREYNHRIKHGSSTTIINTLSARLTTGWNDKIVALEKTSSTFLFGKYPPLQQ